MTRSELVQTAFLACLTAEEHECREGFLYKEQRIFGPHFNVDELAELAARGANEMRPATKGRPEYQEAPRVKHGS